MRVFPPSVFLFVRPPFSIIGLVGAAQESTGLIILGFAGYRLGALATLVPSLAVAVRRLHDINKSGWYYFIALIPLVGTILFLVWFFTDGDRFANKYGEDPKNPAGPAFDFEQANPVLPA